MTACAVDPPKSKYAASLNTEKLVEAMINASLNPDEVVTLLHEVAQENDNFTKTRRGTQGWGTTERLARTIMRNPRSLDKLLRRGLGRAANAEELEALSSLVTDSAINARRAAEEYYANQTNDNLLAMEEARLLLTAIQGVYSGAATEAGRALGILRKAKQSAKETREYLENLRNQYPVDTYAAWVKDINDVGRITQLTRETFKATKSDVFLEVWINALLSGPQTHVVNILSNMLVSIFTSVEMFIAAGVGKFTPGDSISFKEASAYAIGTIQGAMEGIFMAPKAFMTEVQTGETFVESRNMKAISAASLGLDPESAAGKRADKIGRVVRVPGRALMAMDEFFKQVGRRQMLNMLAMRQAIEEGNGDADRIQRRYESLRMRPTEEMKQLAQERADYQTFTNKLGQLGRNIQKMATDHPWMRLIMPFIRTPTNIIKFAGHRASVLALASPHMQEMLKEGGIQRDEAIARMSVGTGVAMAVVYYAAQGLITGNGPEDEKERAAFYADGKQPYSILINGKWYSYGRLEPLGMLLGVVADGVSIFDQMSKDDTASWAALVLGSVSSNLTNKTYLRGVSELLQAINDPERYGRHYITGLLGTVVPTGVAQLTRVQDPYLRDAQSVWEGIKARVPGGSVELPMRYDILGNEIRREGGVGPDILSPIYLSTAKNNPVIQAMRDANYYPGSPRRSIMGVDLDPKEYATYSRLSGQFLNRALSNLVLTPGFTQLPRGYREDLMRKFVNHSRRAARDVTIRYYHPEIATRIMQSRAEQRAGI